MMVLLLAALLALAPPQGAQNNAVIEGRVLRAGSLEPIPNVQVTLVKSSGTVLGAEAAAALESLQTTIALNPGLPQATIDSLATSRETALGLPPGTLSLTSQTSALTDAAGHFSFKDQAPGKYTVRTVLDGFFGPPVNGFPASNATKTVTVEAQKATPPTDIFMVKGGIISGRVRDPNGQPASGITVAANRVTYANGRPQWSSAMSKATDDRGEYRIFWVGPGEYYVGVTPRAVGTIPGPQDTWARTFFPGVSDAASASALRIKDGSEIAGIDFTIQTLASSGSFKISGKATNPQAVPNPTTGVVDRTQSSFILSPREPGILDSVNPPAVQNALPATARPNGEFEIRNVRPGSYDLITYAISAPPPPPAPAPAGTGTPAAPAPPPPSRRYYIDRIPVDIRNSDVDGITLEVHKGTEIRGKVVNQGSGSVPVDKVKISLHSQDTMPEAFATIVGTIPVDSNGEFTAPDIASAKYSLQITGLPATAYVADIRQSGTSIFDSWLTVGEQAVTSLEILVNSNGATVEGAVQGSDHKPAVNATVVLVPPANHRQNVMMYKTAQTDDMGNFSMKGIPPGEYNLFAWESVPPMAWMNSEFLTKYQNRARPVNTTQGTRLDAQLELIPDEINNRQ